MNYSVSLLKAKKAPAISKKVPKTVAEPSAASVSAGDSLLRAVKRKMLRQHGKIDSQALRRKGYSETLIKRLAKL